MIKRVFTWAVLLGFAFLMLPLIQDFPEARRLGPVASRVAAQGAEDLGGANLVTSVVVTYRGLDTLGEVTVLFLATAGVGFVLRRREKRNPVSDSGTDASEILKTGARVLLPVILLFGVYVFTHGHLTPGGGFQGGVILATGMLLAMLAGLVPQMNQHVLHAVESVSGTAILLLGLAGLVWAGGFLDSRFLPAGKMGALFSAGAIPLIYTFIGLKVGTEMVGIIEHLRKEAS